MSAPPQKPVEGLLVFALVVALPSVPALYICLWAIRNQVQGAWLVQMTTATVAMLVMSLLWELWCRTRGRKTMGKSNERSDQ